MIITGTFSVSCVGAASLCLALGCAPARHDALSVPALSQRWVLAPSALSVLSGARAVEGVPGEVTFGGAGGRSALYLQFPSEWQNRGVPVAAFLALETREDAIADSTPVTLEVWRVRSPWQAAALRTWSDKPNLAPPFARMRTTPTLQEVRIDVTELTRFMALNPTQSEGFAVLAESGAGHGASYATGMQGGRAPRLELYLR